MSQQEICTRIADTLVGAPIHDHLGYEALAYLKLPGPNYLALLQTLHRILQPKLYVEIGVRRGDSMRLANETTRIVGIDPSPAVEPRPNTLMAVSTSDDFFAVEQNREACRGFDLAFIDGDHSCEQALRDFNNLEALAKTSSIICIHDVIPMDLRTAQPHAEGVSFHTGDVWRLMAAIAEGRPDLVAFTVATPPTGLGIVGRFGPSRFIGADHWVPGEQWAHHPFIEDWDTLAETLRIVPNEAGAILKGLAGGA